MMSAVSASSSARPRGTFRRVDRCCPNTRQANRSETRNFRLTWLTQARRRAGLRTFSAIASRSPRRRRYSRGGLARDQLLEREVRNGLPQPLVLLLQLLEPFHLVGLQPAELLPPSVVREPRHADRAYRLGHRPALRHQHVDPPELGDDLFRLVLLPGHSLILHLARKPNSGRTTFQGAGHPAARPSG